MQRRLVGTALALLFGCGGGGEPMGKKDAAADSCKLELSLGRNEAGRFVELASGDTVELVLGFQGIQMLQLSLGVSGTRADATDVVAHIAFDAIGQSLDQRDRGLDLVDDGAGARRVEDYIVFVNDVAAAAAIGTAARVELIARIGDCQGTLVRELVLRDDDACVDFDVVIDASTEANVPDGSVPCGDPP
jgi:hypothetical protein